MYSTVPELSAHTAQQKTSHALASLTLRSLFISRRHYLSHQEILGEMLDVPLKGRKSRSEQAASTGSLRSEIQQKHFAEAASNVPQGGLKM